MARVSNLLSWFFFCMAGVLVTVAMLAVPENAFADDGDTWCATYCYGVCSGDITCIGNCTGPCHDGYYNCDDCANYSSPQDTYCNAGCLQAGKSCNAVSGNRRCDDGCYFDPKNATTCSITVLGSNTGCVLGMNNCATCVCSFNVTKDDCWCK